MKCLKRRSAQVIGRPSDMFFISINRKAPRKGRGDQTKSRQRDMSIIEIIKEGIDWGQIEAFCGNDVEDAAE